MALVSDSTKARFSKLHPHRIMPMCVKLEDVRDLLLAFVDVLEEKFAAIVWIPACAGMTANERL